MSTMQRDVQVCTAGDGRDSDVVATRRRTIADQRSGAARVAADCGRTDAPATGRAPVTAIA